MDPNQAFVDLIHAFKDGDCEQAETVLDDLLQWVRRGGFLPTIEGHAQAYESAVYFEPAPAVDFEFLEEIEDEK